MPEQSDETLRTVLRLYRASAIGMIILCLVGYYLQFLGTDAVAAIIALPGWGTAFTWCLLGSAGGILLTLWYASIRYALLTTELVFPRAAVVATAVIGQVLYAFFYYWLAVHWRKETRRLLGTVSTRPAAA